MKRCFHCKKLQSIHNFYKKTTKCKRKRSSWCKSCDREQSSKFAKKRFKKLRQFIRSYKYKPCMDCHKSYPYYVMDFDHRNPRRKEFQISTILSKRSMTEKRLKKEIKKCDVVCANCHRIRTYKKLMK